MNKIYFAIALHFHQPTGNFAHILERAYQSCYKPFFELLSLYPQIKLTVHISGCLFDYLDQSHAQLIKLLQRLVARRQVELISGGYYEPILVGIPERDLISQLGLMSQYIQHKFNTVPQGMWVPERVWQPRLSQPISKAGIRYLILDDEHLLRSGIDMENIHSFFLTGKGKEKVAVFPSDKRLRYIIPFELPEKTLDYFQEVSQKQEDMLFTYADDGEKFGEWPGTHKWVFTEGWLRKFFDILTENKNWIELVHFSDYLQQKKPRATLTIKEGSYHEMMEWSGGRWINFFTKYPQANQMHKRMLFVSAKLKQAEQKARTKQKEKLELARRQLFMGQCNCAYWHGVFGGLYLYHLRRAVYQHLIKAEKIVDGLLQEKDSWLNIRRVDFDLDARPEIIMENKDFFICIDPQDGGVIRELDYKPLCLNLVNTLSRKKESYHHKILEAIQSSKEKEVSTIHDDFRTVSPSLKNELRYDKFGRYLLRSFFVNKGIKLEDFVSAKYDELGNFSTAPFTAQLKQKTVMLKRQAQVLKTRLQVSKQIRIKSKDEIEVLCSINKCSDNKFAALVGMEFNVTMPDLDSERYYYTFDREAKMGLGRQGEILSCSFFGINDLQKELGIGFGFSPQAKQVFYFPVKTVSQSERTYELNYQCSCIMALWEAEFDRKGSFEIQIGLQFLTGER